TARRWQRSPQPARPPPSKNDPPLPNQPHDPANPSNRVLPSMLAPNPSQHLESENPTPGNPLQRFSLPGSCSRLYLTNTVVPAEAGTHFSTDREAEKWVPAFAGMTI